MLLRMSSAGVGVSAAGWVLLGLTLELSLPVTALTESDPGFSLCRQCFYRQTPPPDLSGGDAALLTPLCHRLPGGQSFATLYHPSCDAAVYTGFQVRQGWGSEEEGTENQEEESRGEVGEEGEEQSLPQVMTPALLRGAKDEPQPLAGSPFNQWDFRVSELVQSNMLAQCGSTGGQLYILTGATGLRPGGQEAGGCEVGALWTAVCCVGPEGQGGFSVGLFRETGGQEERVLRLKELEDVIGVTELFLEGCTGAGGDSEGDMVTLLSEAKAGTEGLIEEGEAGDTEEEMPPSDDSESLSSESDTESSNSTLVYILTSSVSLLTAPLCPVVSTLVSIPGQVNYVLQEDLAILSALPGDTLAVFYNMASDLVSGSGSVISMIYGVGEMCVSIGYSITAPLVGTLLSNCQEGVTGLGTLAGEGVGIFEGLLDNAWWVSRSVGDQAWEQGGGYVGAVVSELGVQLSAVGGGLGKLVWRCGNGVGNVIKVAEWLVVGSVETVVDNVIEVFGQNQKVEGSTENVQE